MADASLSASRSRSLLPSWETVSYVLRRWPIVPILIIVVLVVVGLFAPIIAPHDPLEIDLESRNTPPFWYQPR